VKLKYSKFSEITSSHIKNFYSKLRCLEGMQY